MHELHELKEVLMEELEEYGMKEMTVGTLDVVDKLTHTIKNLDKIIEKCEEEEYSGMPYGREDGGSYARGGRSYARGGRSYARGGNSYDDMSYARRRDSRGRYSRGYYSRDKELVADLRELMEDAPDERTKQEFKRFIAKIEKM